MRSISPANHQKFCKCPLGWFKMLISEPDKHKLNQTRNVFGEVHQSFAILDCRFERNRGKTKAGMANCM